MANTNASATYTEYKYLWPPRPETKIMPATLHTYEGRYLLQVKKNGTRCPVFTNGVETVFMGRHGEDDTHEAWKPKAAHFEFFRKAVEHWTGGEPKWFVFDAELLHSKVSGGPRDLLYIFDILVCEGHPLVGWELEARQELLYKLFGVNFDDEDPVDVDSFRVHEHVVVARNFYRGFHAVFKTCPPKGKGQFPEREGVVVKRLGSRLAPMSRENNNSNWQAKARVAKGYASF